MRPRRLKPGTHVDSGQMYRVYWNQDAAVYSSLYYFFSFLSLQNSNIKIFCCTFLRNLRPIKLILDNTWTLGGCIVYNAIRLLLLICPLFFSFFFLSNVKNLHIFVTLFSGTVRPRKFTLVDNGWMYRVYQNQAAAAYLSLYFFIFLSLKLSIINIFRHTFLGKCEA